MKSNEGQYAVKSLNQTVRFPSLPLARNYLEQMKRMGMGGELIFLGEREKPSGQDRKD